MNALTPSETQELAQLEKTIFEGKKIFESVGQIVQQPGEIPCWTAALGH